MRVETLMPTPLLTFIRSEHMPGMIRYGTEEEDEASHDVTFVEAGEFGVNEFHLSEGSMLVQRAGTVHRYTHREDFAPDVCLTVRFAETVNNVCDRELATCGIAPRVLEERHASPHTLASMAVRLDAARRMLLDGAPVTNVCYDSGFSNLSHFIHIFKRRFGCTPSAL